MKAYFYILYRLSAFFKDIADDGLENVKAIAIVCILWACLLLDIIVWFTLITGQGVDLNAKYFALFFGMAISFINVYLYYNKRRRQDFLLEFKKIPRQKIKLYDATIGIVIVAIIASVIVSYYELSLSS